MATKVTDKIKQAFIALPHVDEMWVTSDGHFHLHEIKEGAKHIMRKDVSFEDTKPVPVISEADKAIISEIDKATSPEQVDAYIAVGATDVVLKAAEEKKALLNGPKSKK